MKKEEWIDQIMASSSDIKAAEPNPYLFNKIKLAIENPLEKKQNTPSFKWAFAFVFFVSINVACISFISYNQKQLSEQTEVTTVYSEMNLNTIYSY